MMSEEMLDLSWEDYLKIKPNQVFASGSAPDSPEGLHMTVFGPRFERDEYGHVCAVRYRCSDTHPAGNYRVWELLARPMDFHADAQGSARAA